MPPRRSYRSVRWGVETLPTHCSLPRHRHRGAYANVVLSGAFVEASFAGRFRAEAGDVLLHGSFDCHSNDQLRRGRLQVLRLPWFDGVPEGLFRVLDPDALVRIAQEDPLEAARHLALTIQARPCGGEGWPELLAGNLRDDASLSLRHWAQTRGLAFETLSRGFGRAFGVSPKLFRLEARTRRAWNCIVGSQHSLTDIAHAEGFADLAHMSRSVRDFTGAAPSEWRAAHQQRRLSSARAAGVQGGQ